MAKKDSIEKAINKASKSELKRKSKPEKSPLPEFKESDVTRCLELLQDIESNNGHVGIAKILGSEGIVMMPRDVRDIDEERAARLADLEAH
jgi:hypothetical protein